MYHRPSFPKTFASKFGRHRVQRRHRVLARVLLLLDAVLVTDRARVERLHRLGGVQVAALDLAVRLVGLAETTLEAHEGLGALLVREATRELDVALGEEALAGLDDASVDGPSSVREGEGERGGGGEGGDAAAELLPRRAFARRSYVRSSSSSRSDGASTVRRRALDEVDVASSEEARATIAAERRR